MHIFRQDKGHRFSVCYVFFCFAEILRAGQGDTDVREISVRRELSPSSVHNHIKLWKRPRRAIDHCLCVCLQIEKGKQHGSIDVGLSFVTHKRNGRRIDIDAEDLIYHLKVGAVWRYAREILRPQCHRDARRKCCCPAGKDGVAIRGLDFATAPPPPLPPTRDGVRNARRAAPRRRGVARTHAHRVTRCTHTPDTCV